MTNYSGSSATVARTVDNKGKNSRQRERNARMRRRRARLRMLAIGMVGIIFAFLAMTTVSYYVQVTELKGEVETKKSTLAQLDSEFVSLTAKKQNSIDLSYVEEYAENVLGLVKMDRSQEEYLELQKTDQVEVNEASSGVEKLVSSFVKSFNAILSFLR
ncbi:MAG: hypothetical protein Q4P20_00240 [Eubacteriales bacterium]|nr:hypothetical protein [Eubacteriales bacterium]